MWTSAASDVAGSTLFQFSSALAGYDNRELARASRPSSSQSDGPSKFEQIYHNAAVGIAATDLTERFIVSNPRFCQIVRHSEEELRSLLIHDISQ